MLHVLHVKTSLIHSAEQNSRKAKANIYGFCFLDLLFLNLAVLFGNLEMKLQ